MTLALVCDTFVPSINSEARKEFFERSATSIGTDAELARIIEDEMDESQQRRLTSLLDLFESRLRNIMLNSTTKMFSSMSLEERQAYLFNKFGSSSVPLKRTAFQALKRLTLLAYYGFVPPGLDENPNWKDIGYKKREGSTISTRDKLVPLIQEGNERIYECDVCVVGSGSGGSTIAEYLSRVGWRVMVVESGEYLTSEDFTGGEYEMTSKLFEQSGRASTKDLSVSLLEGHVGGGSTVVNWNTCIIPPEWLLDEWGSNEGITGLKTKEFENCVASVWNALKVNRDESKLNRNNEVLLTGCEKLGYSMPDEYDIIYRNAVGCDGRCDFCGYGCQYACKQSTSASVLVEAQRHGTKFLFNSEVDHIIIEGGRAGGVVGKYKGKTVFEVRSKIVVLAAGSINTPAILLRSGLRRNVGTNLHLHPTTAVSGLYDEPVNMWEGPPQTVKVTKGLNIGGDHHGYWIEAVPGHPALFSAAIPWTSGRAHKDLALEMPKSSGTIVLVRETSSGKVSVDKKGRPVCEYRMNEKDKATMMDGIIEAGRILAASGARKISTLHHDGLAVGSQHALAKADIEKFEAEVRKRGIVPNKVGIFSAHIMGSARMGHEKVSFCDDNAQSYDLPGLFIGDASVLPTSLGVNPMITIMSMSLRNAIRMDGILRR